MASVVNDLFFPKLLSYKLFRIVLDVEWPFYSILQQHHTSVTFDFLIYEFQMLTRQQSIMNNGA